VLQPGDVLKDTYRIELLHARGGMAMVYKVEHIGLGVKRALKVLLPQFSCDAECASRFRKEAKIMATFKHPNIAEVYDFGTTADGLLYLVMEWLEGEDLHHFMKRQPQQPIPVVLWLCEQVGAALAAAHRVGIVHRDLKPGNIYMCRGLNGEKVVKVMDFGIARQLRPDPDTPEATRPGSLLGTPGYMAPEQFTESLGPVGPASDQFALSVIAYELLLGQRLFPSPGTDLEALYELSQRVISGQFPPLPYEVDTAVGAVLRRALNSRPEARFPDIALFVAALPQASSAPPPTPAPSAGTPWPLVSETLYATDSKRGLKRVAAMGITVLSAVAAVVLGHHVRPGLRPPLPERLASAETYTYPIQEALSHGRLLHVPTVSNAEAGPVVGAQQSSCAPTFTISVRASPKTPWKLADSQRWQRKARQCIASLHLGPYIRRELVLQRSRTPIVVSPFPERLTEILDDCMERNALPPVPAEIHVYPSTDTHACVSRQSPGGSNR
jgi:serine/threonine protein kinase